jgi:2-C-methyl-D-erythritol 4-phosphate cytidylyltransferase
MVDKYWIIVPAAGIGKRFGGDIPKQYALIEDKSVLEITLQKLLSWQHTQGIIVAIGEQDNYWSKLDIARDPRVVSVIGGYSRIESVHNALEYLTDKLAGEQLVLVHDSVRPCISLLDLDHLLEQVSSRDAVGGLLAYPVADTLKQSRSDNSVVATISRTHMWQAATPQIFPLALLRDALAQSQQDESITDEASSIEKLGHTPLIVEGDKRNIKITTAQDLQLATYILHSQNAL